MKIIIGGDVCPINSNEKYFNNNSSLFGDFQEIFDESDLNIVNLEAPITNSSKKILKSGKNIKSPLCTAISLKKSKIDLVSIANNHMGDYSQQGIYDTINYCKKSKLKFVGAGLNLRQAKKPIIIGNETKIGVLSFSDKEFGVATENRAGVNPLDLCELTLNLIKLKKKVDYCIVILHEGKEHYEYPSPELQKICRYVSDIGADLIVCQHSHIIGAWETYNSSNIFYGQGNLMFDFDKRNSKSWNNGFLIQIELNKNKLISITQIPYVQSFPGIKKLDKIQEKEFHKKSKEMQKNVLNKEFIEKSWNQFIKTYKTTYYSIFRGHNRILRKINYYTLFSNLFYSKINKAYLLNIFRSRVHREIVIDILKNDIKKF